MRRALVLLAALAPLWCGGAQKRKAPRPPDVRVVEVSCHRSERVITVDGRVLNSGSRALAKLTLIFHFRTTDGQVITTQRGTVAEGLLSPGEESEFNWQIKDHARAVEVIIEAVDGSGRDLMVARPGPYPVE
ncbi:MAG: hypothetical protein FJW34_22525 [Acidobacteria bacterium]|nr:hypothetical protein [Acidobacteriota bacterium]